MNIFLEYLIIKKSGLFDANYYYEQYPDVRRADMDPLMHFVKHGWREGRNPNGQFNTSYYLKKYKDVQNAEVNPFVHYIRHGQNEHRQISQSIGISPKEDEYSQYIIDSIGEHVAEYPQDYLALKKAINDLKKSTKMEAPIQTAVLTKVQDTEITSVIPQLNFHKTDNPQISIIIPVYNKPALLLECLLSIIQKNKASIDKFEVVIVQDGEDIELKEILEQIPNIKFFPNNAHLGFAQSCNNGASAAGGNILLFLNSDTQIASDNFIETMQESFRNGSAIGAVGPMVLYPNGVLQEAGAVINRDGTTTMIGYGENPEDSQHCFKRAVDYVSGVCVAIPKQVFKEVGGFDPQYSPAYYEDVDLCLKIKNKGYTILFNPECMLYHHLSATTNTLGYDFKYHQVIKNRIKFLNTWQDTIDEINRVRLIAFYLPQFHTIPENDIWWGKGFTEWRNVAKATPIFEGHYQPHLPADLGFYDLANINIMKQQAELARKFGIYGFCYYYYWFNGKRLLEMPLERMLLTNEPDFPFCLCWANENWTARWDGGDKQILLEQEYNTENDLNVIQDLIRYFKHPNYIKVNGKPLILVYRVDLFPDFSATVKIWREECRSSGIGDIHIVMVESFQFSLETADPSDYGADAAVEFPPHGNWPLLQPPGELLEKDFHGGIMSYDAAALSYAAKSFPHHIRYKTAMPSWDNTARIRTTPSIYYGATPGKYQAWLEQAICATREQYSGDHRMVFINAWNEWGEGNHLEPDQHFGYSFLDATRNAAEHWLLDEGN